jgi:pyruvate dehydrogenase E1 component alpha subunit
MAEMFGKLAGCAKGKGGSMHMFDKPNHLFGGHGIVGAQTPLGAGLAFAERYKWEVMGTGKKQVASATSATAHSTRARSTRRRTSPASQPAGHLHRREQRLLDGHRDRAPHRQPRTTCAPGEGYGIKAHPDRRLDIRNVYDAFKPYADECRDMQRPGFVDLKTYRYQGHSMSDPQKYRTKDEVDQFNGREKDSIAKAVLAPEPDSRSSMSTSTRSRT